MSHEGRTEDEAAIVRLLTTYARAADRMDASLLEGIFAPGAEIDLGQIYRGGPDGFTPVVMGFMGSMAATRHALTNPLVVFHGPDRAGAETQVTGWHRIETPEGTRELVVHGRYLDRAERTAAGWRLTYHSELLDWGEMRAVDPGWFDMNAELEKGSRDRGDRSYAVLGGG